MLSRLDAARPGRWPSRAAAVALAGLVPALFAVPAPAADTAPAPRPVSAAAKALTATELDQAVLDEVKANAEIMKNLEFLSDTIGPRLTGSRNLERANEWTAAKMREYGLENVHLEPWEIPVGWERGTASLKVVEPDTGVRCLVNAAAWTPGIPGGKAAGEVMIVRIRSKDDFAKYRGKLRNAVVMSSPPATVAPITDLSYGPLPPAKSAPKKDEPKKDEPKKDEPKKVAGGAVVALADEQPPEGKKADDPKQPEGKKDLPPLGGSKEQPKKDGGGAFANFVSQAELADFYKAEGVLCTLSDSAKPHGLMVAGGSWRGTDRGAPQDIMPRLLVAHEHYAMLWRLASRPAPAVTKVEVEITNRFVPGPITCYNTVGEIKGSEKPDEFVIVGAHLDSWDLGTGTMDNGTGSCVTLEVARALAKLAKEGYRPKRTIRFILYTGEEQGLWGSRKYVERHEAEMDNVSLSLVHDTGTGRVTGYGVHGNEDVKNVLEPELVSLTTMAGWRGVDLGGVNGSDHQAYHPKGVPGLACRQDIDEYRLTHHTQTDTFDHAKGPNLVQGAQVQAVTATRVANMSQLLPRFKPTSSGFGGGGRKRDFKKLPDPPEEAPKKDAPEGKNADGKKDEAPMPRSKKDD
ncbi:MAG: M20/M25/M40 family metallo-hydrolase [Gemmataceae bacterium]|nr:M20/M25/M40 family metallo-hydrolase [Gemmataceae bacterium]